MNLLKFKIIVLGSSLLLLAGCSDDVLTPASDSSEVTFTGSLEPFVGGGDTRASLDGLSLESGDQFRMKIICPHSSGHELGELWSSGYYTLTYSGSGVWTSGSLSSYQSQATTYVYTAINTTMTRNFVAGTYYYSRPSNAFYADQSKLDQYKKSDILWAQSFRQTGANNVHLYFQHKMARLDITIDDSALKKPVIDESGNTTGEEQAAPFSTNAILTLENMPDIDGAEIVIGDYYADDCYEDSRYTYRDKSSCSYGNNGKVLGIEVIDEAGLRSKIWPMRGNPTNPGGKNSSVYGTGPVPNEGTYIAYRAGDKHYQLLVPPCTLEEGHPAIFWIRDGERRYSVELPITQFAEGTNYPVKLVFGVAAPPFDPSTPTDPTPTTDPTE